MPDQKAGAGESLAEHKQRVMKAANEHADAQRRAAQASGNRPPEGFPKSPTTQSVIPDFMQGMGVQTPQVPGPQAAAPQPAPQNGSNGQAQPQGQGAQEPEWQKFARERGWKDAQDAVTSYRNLEREFHSRMNQQAQVPPQMPPPQYGMRPPQAPMPYPQQVQYVPQPAPVNIAQQLARRHGIPQEDAERLLPFVADVSNALTANALEQERSMTRPVIENLQRTNERNEDMMEILQDPAMRVPRVQYEVNQILAQNPTIFSYEARPLRYALDRALRTIATENLGAYSQPMASQPYPYPTNPPVTAGASGIPREGSPLGGGMDQNMTQNYFKLKTADEKKEMLRALGVVKEA